MPQFFLSGGSTFKQAPKEVINVCPTTYGDTLKEGKNPDLFKEVER
jgi:hypothetical protein